MRVDDLRPEGPRRCERTALKPELLPHRPAAAVNDREREPMPLALELVRHPLHERPIVGIVRARVERRDEQDPHVVIIEGKGAGHGPPHLVR
jgi:hypothetical protein